MKEGASKGPEEKFGYKTAEFVKKKSLLVGGAAVAIAVFVPPIAAAAAGVAIWEGVQVIAAEDYKKRQKGETTVFLPKKQLKKDDVALAA